MFLNPFLTLHGGLLLLVAVLFFGVRTTSGSGAGWITPGPRRKRSRPVCRQAGREVRGW